MHINIVSIKNSVGLQADVDILSKLLVAHGHEVSFHGFWEDPPRRFEVNLFLELLSYDWIKAGEKNLIIPNPECFPSFLERHLQHTDTILCKTRLAYLHSFRDWPNKELIGFTSYDRYDPSIKKDYNSCLHIMGKSQMKGTSAVLKAWRENPDLPPLTIVTSLPESYYFHPLPPHVELVDTYLSTEELTTLINKKGIHICPSEAEGWGHYIHEGMSAKALVLTTNAPPMNEFVDESTGRLVGLREHYPCAVLNQSLAYYVSKDALAQAVRDAVALPEGEKIRLGSNARAFYLDARAKFETQFKETLNRVTSS